MAELRRTSCCGMRDYNGLMEFDSMKDLLVDLYNRFYNNDGHWSSGAFILFTCATQERRIPRLIKFITDNALGICTKSESVYNPNSNHNLEAMFWAVNHNAYKIWYALQLRLASGAYAIGDKVRNVSRGSKRYGQMATVITVNRDTDSVNVKYEDASTGTGEVKHYKIVAE